LWANFQLDKLTTDDKYPILEQVVIAALDLHDHELLKQCLSQLETKFPASARVKRIKTMARLELRERYDEALKVYDDMIKADEANSILYKRKIAIIIAQRRIPEAVKELTEYLKKFMNDQEAWMELSDIYIQEQEYHKAAFCLEELILLNPHNTLYHTRLGEIYYTMSTGDSLDLARSYFAQAIKLNPNNLRGLYGLFLSTTHPASKSTSQKKKENQRVSSWCLSKISSLYQENGIQEDPDEDDTGDSSISNKEIMESLESLVSYLSIGSSKDSATGKE
jgi:tetratricopeptide (TPR) repeat protein